MRAEVMPKPELPGHAVLRVHELAASPDGLTICIERRQGPEKYLSNTGWQRSESWLAPERIQAFAGGIDFHVGPIVCDMVAGLTVRLSIREPSVGNIGATVVAWPTMQTSGAYDPDRMVISETAAGTDRGFATGSAPTTVARLPEALQMPPQGEAPPPQPPPPFQFAPPEPPPPFQPPPQEPPPPFQFGPPPEPPPFQFGGPPPFDASPATVVGPGLRPPDPMMDRIGGGERKKSSAGVWIALSIVLMLLLAGIGAGAFWYFGTCDWCRVPGGGTPEGPEAEPERVVADKFIKTSPTPEAAVQKCRALRQEKKLVAAFLICRHAAEAGDPVGAAEYAAFFDPVNPVPNSPIPADAAQAVQWYGKAAKGELPLAMLRLGQLYAKGADGLPADKAKACEWLTKAADKGEAEAKKTIADLQCS